MTPAERDAATPTGLVYPHGTITGYGNYRCRCTACTEAVASVGAHRRRTGLPVGDSRHGTANGYVNYACRCAPCTEAGRVKNARRRTHQNRRGEA